MMLKTSQAAAKMRRCDFLAGRRMEERNRGMVGMRKRASWCCSTERTRIPEMAEYKRSDAWGRKKRRKKAGPRSCGRLKRRCV